LLFTRQADRSVCNKLRRPAHRSPIMRTRSDYPFVTAVIEIFADWWKQRRDR